MSHSEYLSLSGSNTGVDARLYIQIGDDAANNRSLITVTLQARKTNGASSTGTLVANLTIGSQNTDIGGSTKTVGTSYVNLGVAQRYVSHGTDGVVTGAWGVGCPGARLQGTGDWANNESGSTTLEVGNFTDYARPPGAPGANVVSNLTSTGFKVSWGAASSVVTPLDYGQYLALDSGFATYAVTATWLASGVREYTYTGLQRGTDHWFRTRARSSEGSGAYNTAVKITTPHTVPDKPATPVLSSVTQNSAVIATTPPAYVGAGVTAREVRIQLNGVTVETKTTEDPTFTGLTRNSAYKVSYRVQNAIGWSSWSNEVDVQTPGTVPSAPTSYAAYDIASTSAMVSTGTIADNGGAVPSQARVKVSTTQSDVGLVQTVTSPEWAPIRLSGLTKNTQYWVAEAAYNTAAGGGWGAYGAWVPLLTRDNVPNGPVVTSSAIGGTVATLQWAAPTALNGAVVDEYHVLIAKNASLTDSPREFVVNSSTFAQVVDLLTPGTPYWAVVWTTTNNGRGSTSAIHTFTTTGGGGSTSGVWLDVAGTPKFCQVWLDVGGVPKLCEVWLDVAGVPKKLIQ